MYCRIKPEYDSIQKNVPIYSKRKRLVGEIDILAMKEGKYDVYEVKCSHRFYKARKQLTKIKKIFRKESKKVNNLFFYCGESEVLTNIEFNQSLESVRRSKTQLIITTEQKLEQKLINQC